MLENTFRSKGPELLVELAEHAAQTVRQIIDVDPAIASQIGDAVANQMMRVWGGQNVYFPMGLMWKINQRDREIFADFNGHNHHALARKYKVSLQWIYAVVKRMKKETLSRVYRAICFIPIRLMIPMHNDIYPFPHGNIHCGDCLDVMKTLPAESIRIIVTSPPYNLKNSAGNGMTSRGSGKWTKAALRNGYDGYDDNLPHHDYVAWQRACLNEMMRLLRPDGVIFYNHKWRVQAGLLQDRQDIMAGFPVRQIIIWQRSGGINFNSGYFLPTYEVIYMITQPDFRLKNHANRLGDVWKIPQERNNPHPAPFPLALAQRCLESVEPGPVLDPFLGSGTTAVAAEKLAYPWLGIEKSASYLKLAKNRLHDFLLP